jgi:hypothetical protein
VVDGTSEATGTVNLNIAAENDAPRLNTKVIQLTVIFATSMALRLSPLS